MKYIVDNDLHIHSQISLCSSDPEQTNERILQYAKDNSLKNICLTDHFWDENVPGASDWYALQNYPHISAAKPLPQADGIKFMFGCETELDKNMTLGISKEKFDKFDFIIIPTTHFHMVGFTISPEIQTPEQKAEFWLKKFNAVLDMDLPFHKVGMAHLVCGLMDQSRENVLKIVGLLSDTDLQKVFKRAADKGVGIELNADDMKFKDEEKSVILRPFEIAKKEGCKFYLGSDAHHPKNLNEAKVVFERAVNLLDLTEEDKFTL